MKKLIEKALKQNADLTGLRKTRWAVVTDRKSIPRIVDGLKEGSPSFIVFTGDKVSVGYGNDVFIELLFVTKNTRPEKFLSTEFTGAWADEMSDLSLDIVRALAHRVGRFPHKKDGGATWWGILVEQEQDLDDRWFVGGKIRDYLGE